MPTTEAGKAKALFDAQQSLVESWERKYFEAQREIRKDPNNQGARGDRLTATAALAREHRTLYHLKLALLAAMDEETEGE